MTRTNLLINEIEKKINNLEYRIEGTLQRNRIQNINFDSNLENLISIHDLLVEVKTTMLLQANKEDAVYDLGYLRKMFVKFHIFKKRLWIKKI